MGLAPGSTARVREAAEDLLDDVRRGVPTRAYDGFLVVRSSLVIPAGEGDRSSLHQMMGASKGWARALRLKIYLVLLWARTNGVPEMLDGPLVPVVGRQIAAVLNLADADTTGARDVNQAVRELATLGFVKTSHEEMRRGRRLPIVTVLDESGDGSDYVRPSVQERTVRLGNAFVTGGWLASLSGPALAALLIFALEAQEGTSAGLPFVWIPGSSALQTGKRWYGVPVATIKKGCDELTKEGLMKRSSHPPPPGSMAESDGKTWPVGYFLSGTKPWLHGRNRREEVPRVARRRKAALENPWRADRPAPSTAWSSTSMGSHDSEEDENAPF